MRLLRTRVLTRSDVSDIVTGSDYTPTDSVRGLRLIAMCAFLIIITASASVFALNHTGKAPVVTTNRPTPAVLSETTQASPVQSTASTPSGSNTTAHQQSVTHQCTRGSYGLPAPIPAAGRAAGVYVQKDPAMNYQIYGTTTDTIMSQMAACSPVRSAGVFAANTGYSLSNYYTYGVGSDGLCRVTSVVVTQHINQIFPNWNNTGTNATTQSRWNTFIASLRLHEQGHVNLDENYAYKLYDAIRQVPAQSCGTFSGSVDTSARSVMNELQVANDNYDATTNHGTTQGAVL